MAPSSTFKRIQAWRSSVQDLLLPPRCQLCGDENSENLRYQICDSCQQHLVPRNQIQCQRCGALRPQDQQDYGCRVCQHLELPFGNVTAIGNYADSLRLAVIEMKRTGNEALVIQFGQWLGWILAEQDRVVDIDYMVSVPTHWIRRMKRGTTISELLVEGIRRHFRRPVLNLLSCNRLTGKQGRLSTQQRYQNVKNCFDFHSHKSVAGKNILLVDDVMTSCATAVQAASTILKHGKAARVDLALVARGVSNR